MKSDQWMRIACISTSWQRSAWLLIFAGIFIAGAGSALAQSNPNEDQGLKPYDSWHGGDLDSISVINGGLNLHIPLVSFPQRGNLNLSFFIRFNNKQWFVRSRCNGVPPHQTCTSNWVPAPNTGVQIVSSVDWWMQGSYTVDAGDGGTDYIWSKGVSSPDGYVHQLGMVDGSISPSITYPLRSLDATGLVLTNAQTLIMADGTRYSYPTMTDTKDTSNLSGVKAGVQPATITDANGNQIMINSSGWTDTMGRQLPGSTSPSAFAGIQPGVATSDLSTCPSGTTSALVWNVPGPASVNSGVRTFKFCYSNISLATHFNPGTQPNDYSGAMPLLTAVVLPDLTMWTFSYDSYADVTQVGFPTGGSLSYTYAFGPITCSTGTTNSMWVTSRTVNANDGSGGHTWNYSYSTPTNTLYSASGTAVVTSPDGNDLVHNITAPAGACSGFDTQTKYYQGSSSSGALVKTIQTQYSGNQVLDNQSNPIGINVIPTQTTLTLPAGHTSRAVGSYDSSTTNGDGNPVIIGALLEKDEYDFTNTLVRTTANHYLWQDNSTYLNDNLVGLLASTTVKDGGGNQIAQTTYGYDQTAVTTSGITTSLVAPPAGGNIRGNATTISHWLNTSNSSVSATATYLDTGMKASTTDPLSHTTTYSYSSTFAGAYSTQTNMPDTQMPDSGAPTVHHIVSGNYDFNTGLLTSFTDQNGQQFAYQYDIMLRLIQGNHPDGGQTVFTYPDPNTVTRQRLMASGTYEGLYTAKFDGVGRPYQTQQVTPSGTVLVDTTYDSLGREATVSNAYYSGSNHSTDPTYGTVQTQYDALSRVIKSIKQDGSSSTISYSDNCTTTTDEAGKQRKVCSDALGRMVEVDEPNPGAAATNATGWAAVSGSEQTSGSSTPGTGSVTISAADPSGNDEYYVNDPCQDWGGSCPVNVYDTGTVSITVNGHTDSTSYGRSDTPTTIASNLASNINNDSGAYVWASASGATVSLSARSSGSGTNYSLSASSSSNDPTDFTPPSFSASPSGSTLTGGHDPGYDSGTARITVNGTTYTVSYGQGSSASSIATALANTINGDGSRVVNASASGGTVSLTAIASGPGGDYSLSTSYTWNTGSFSQPSFTTSDSGSALTGGYNASDLVNNPYVTIYTYDVLNNLTCVEQHGAASGTGCSANPSSDSSSPWRVRRFSYDSFSRVLTSKNPEAGQISYGYDNNGNLTSKTEPAPNQTGTSTVTITYTYDNLNRLTDKTYSDGTQNSSYRYDYSTYMGLSFQNPIGRQVAATAANATISYFTSYDAMGRVKQTTQCIPGVTNCQSFIASYDLAGDLLTVNYPGNSFSVTYQYDSAARLTTATDSNGVTYAQNPTILASGVMQEFSSPNFNSLKYHTDFNSRLQPVEIWTGTSSGSGALFDKQYTYNPPSTSQMNNGNIYTVTNVKDSTRTQTFTYDVLNRLASAHDGSHWGNTYSYDAWGNLQKIPGSPAGENFQHAADGNNHLVGFSYDAAGNMTNDGATSYVYDAENRITSATANSTTTNYTYDADGRRVKKSGGPNFWYGPGGDVLAETDTSGNWTNYIFFAGQRLARNVPQPSPNPPDIKYYITDHLHSTAMFVDKAGTAAAVLDDNDFYPWGGVVPGVGKTTSNNAIKFTGKYRDPESNLDYFGARYYANGSGRFMSPDWATAPTAVPYAVFGDPQSLNLYAYVRNSPIVRVDVDGHFDDPFATFDTPLNGPDFSNIGSAGNLLVDITITTTTVTNHYADGSSKEVSSTTTVDISLHTTGEPGVTTTTKTKTTPASGSKCYAQGRAKIVDVPGKGFLHAIKQAAMYLFRVKHMFWTVRGSDGVEHDLTAGPSNGQDGFKAGDLGGWSRPLSEYTKQGKVFFTATQTADLCSRVDAMEQAVDDWKTQDVTYSFFSGPNSNGWFNKIGAAGGMPFLNPFYTPGAKRIP